MGLKRPLFTTLVVTITVALPALALPAFAATSPVRATGDSAQALIGNTGAPVIWENFEARDSGVRVADAPGALEFDLYIGLVGSPDLDAFALAVNDPRDADYGRHLGLPGAIETFGPSAAHLTTLETYLDARQIPGSLGAPRTFARLAPNVAQATEMFATTFGVYEFASGADATFVVLPDTQPQLPAPLQPVIDAVFGLAIAVSPSTDSRRWLRPSEPIIASQPGQPLRTGTPSGCRAAIASGAFTPNQLATAYGYDNLQRAGLTGAGVRLAMVEYASIADRADFEVFTDCFGIETTPLRQIAAGGGAVAFDIEPALDVQVVAQVAPGLEAFDLYAYSPERPATSYDDVIKGYIEMLAMPMDPRVYGAAPPDIVSVSYGLCEDIAWADALPAVSIVERTQALGAAAGMTFVVSSGDEGSSACLNISDDDAVNANLPAASAWVLGVGGTALTLDADNQIIGESVWNDTTYPAPYTITTGAIAGGGAASSIIARPEWQRGAGIPAGNTRLVPDIAMFADLQPGWAIACSSVCNAAAGTFVPVGGTSAAAPLFAAILALLTEQARAEGQPRFGHAAPLIYELARLGTPVLRDITIGNNDIADTGCCNATPGWDLASGWGSPNAAALARVLTPPHAEIVRRVTSTTPLRVTYDASGSRNPEPLGNAPLAYDWDLTGDGLPDRYTDTPTLSIDYGSQPEPAVVSVTVRTATGRRATAATAETGRLFDSRTTGALEAGTTRRITLGDAYSRLGALALNITAVDPAGDGYVTVTPCSAPASNVSNLNVTAGRTVANAAVVGIGDGELCITTSVRTQVIIDITDVIAGVITDTTPQRLLDTRLGSGAVAAGSTTVIDVTDRTLTAAAALNITLVDATGTGYVSAYPCSAQRPNTSILNTTPGQTVAGATIGGLDAQGQICIYSSVAGNLIVDRFATFGTDTFIAAPERRLLDTRLGSGPVAAGSTTVIDLAARTGVNGAPGVSLTVTAVGAQRAGYVSVGPCTATLADTSTLNVAVGQTRANAAVVPSTGTICVYSSTATDLLVDISGRFIS